MCLAENQEPRKWKSLMSKVVVPKKFNLNLTWMLVALLNIFTFGICEKFQEGSPVLWRNTNAPPVIGFNSIKLKINLVSTCQFFPTTGLTSAVASRIKNRCEDQYEDLFLNELEKMCPKKSVASLRVKRELFTAIGILIIFAIASARVGMASYAIHEKNEIKLTQLKIERTLDDLEKKATVESKDMYILQEEMKKMGKVVNKLISDVNLFKEKIFEVQYLVSYITSRLLIGRGVILETKRKWRQKAMDDTLFDFLNFTLPCGTDCPIEFGEPKGCQLNDDGQSMYLEFAAPIVNTNLTIVEADPFVLMQKESNQTCKIEYHGPQNAMISPSEDCIYAVNMERESKGRIFFPHSQKCQVHETVGSEKEWFGIQTCFPSKVGDEKSFIQLKAYQNKLYIYCPGSSYTLGGTREVKCPNRVFTLPLTSTFTLNNVTYYGKMMNLVYSEHEDPLLLEKLDWHLTPTVNWDSLNTTFPVFQPLDPDH